MEQGILHEISDIFDNVKRLKPLVHHITNYVTANDCANIVLAIGASPVMADDPEEVDEFVSMSRALVINLGTLNKRTAESMLRAGKKANELGIPVVMDPVGAGASSFRNRTAEKIIQNIKLTVIRGNMSEIKAIAGLGSSTRGVDASDQDINTSKDLWYAKNICENLSERLGCVIAITGATDIVSDGRKTVFIRNGDKMFSSITGAGCMCTSLIGTFCAVCDDYVAAASAGILALCISGEKAVEKLTRADSGSGSFRTFLIDSVFGLQGRDFIERGKIDVSL
ncbi:MAG TPA: hydroxyethylthiazole kinase [Ruminiclostridium sp.]|nr:hydroxyethylthiazole kinase [Clostridiaceae bacterium]HAA24996.1 hydroxyethylthiazole kinase [Ruminiclostridium sp.]